MRQPVEVVPVRPSVKTGITNNELVELFMRSTKLSRTALASYTSAIRDYLRFMKHPDGREIPAAEWTKESIWAHLHFVEANYCASFRTVPTRPLHIVCRQKVFREILHAEEATKICATCTSFKRPMIAHRVNGLSKFFKFLARVGAIKHNIMQDVVADFWEENPLAGGDEEKRRNPTIDEMIRLVNGTLRPMTRTFYATSAKWWYRPNEMFLLDRYASFGVKPPVGVPTPPGFEEGFPKYPHLKGFDEGGDLVYLPKKPGIPDKRQGNRWSVIDADTRPIIEQYFAWWERTVKRDSQGRPTTTALWLSERGAASQQLIMYRSMFHLDTLRLGLVTPAEKDNPRRVWTAHCQRHFGEKILEMHNVPDNWCNLFRGDKLKDARGHYFKPGPDEVREKYHEWVPILGFQALPTTTGFAPRTPTEIHRETLEQEMVRAHVQIRRTVQAASTRIYAPEGIVIVPRRIVAAYLYALRLHHPETEIQIEVDQSGNPGREFPKHEIIALCEKALAMLAPQA